MVYCLHVSRRVFLTRGLSFAAVDIYVGGLIGC